MAPSEIKQVGILAHPTREETYASVVEIAAHFEQAGYHTWTRTDWVAEEIAEMVKASQLIVALGGDGAMLRAARVSAPDGVPVLGVNMGRLGFLTEVPAQAEWETVIKRISKRDYWVEKRMMLKVIITHTDGSLVEATALNDVVISGNILGRMVQLSAYIDGQWAANYNADALIIATATGSTAYALSCGGPILPPMAENLLIVPNAPHLSMGRSIVLPQGAQVSVLAARENRNEIVITVDGNVMANLIEGDKISVCANEHSSSFLRLREPNYFYRDLLDRFEPRFNQEAPSRVYL